MPSLVRAAVSFRALVVRPPYDEDMLLRGVNE